MGSEALYAETVKSDYTHPSSNREYLRATVLDFLEPGLEKMMYVMQRRRVVLASGAEWEDGWRPDGWKPVQALRVGRVALEIPHHWSVGRFLL